MSRFASVEGYIRYICRRLNASVLMNEYDKDIRRYDYILQSSLSCEELMDVLGQLDREKLTGDWWRVVTVGRYTVKWNAIPEEDREEVWGAASWKKVRSVWDV